MSKIRNVKKALELIQLRESNGRIYVECGRICAGNPGSKTYTLDDRRMMFKWGWFSEGGVWNTFV